MNLLKTLITLALLISGLPLFAQDTSTNTAPQVQQAPPIPEEARKHFVMGETMFKEAKSVDNFTLAAGEFKQGADLAPQWPEARYNLALAKEAAGDYSGALDDLKIYQQFKLSDDEARAAQDKIYAIEAKQQMQASDATAKAAADAANAQAAAKAQADADAAKEKAKRTDFIKSIQGSWVNSNRRLTINQLDDTNISIWAYYHNSRLEGQYLPISDISITGTTLLFTLNDPDIIEHYSLSLGGDGRLNGSHVDYFSQRDVEAGQSSGIIETKDCFFVRQ
jgi:hypothetical protein